MYQIIYNHLLILKHWDVLAPNMNISMQDAVDDYTVEPFVVRCLLQSPGAAHGGVQKYVVPKAAVPETGSTIYINSLFKKLPFWVFCLTTPSRGFADQRMNEIASSVIRTYSFCFVHNNVENINLSAARL